MAIQIDVKPEDIDEMVRDAVINAGLGKLIADVLGKQIDITGYNSPVKKEIDAFIARTARAIIEEKFKDEVVAEVTKQLSEVINNDVIANATRKVVDEMSTRGRH